MALGRNDLSSLPSSGAHKKYPNTGCPHPGAVHFLTPSQAESKNWSPVLLLLSDFQVSQVDEAPGKAQLVVQSVKINGEILKVDDSVRDQDVKLQDSLTNIDHAASPKKVRVYISYARSSAEHTNNVAALASWLRDQGIDAICDVFFQLEISRNAPAFIESAIHDTSYIIAVCSQSYLACWQASSSFQNSNKDEQKDFTNSNLELTNFEILLIRNIVFKPGNKKSIVPVELAQPSLEKDATTNAQEPNNAPLDLPVALQGFRMYKIGSLDPNHVSDQQDLLYYLHRRPLFLDQAQQLTEAWDASQFHFKTWTLKFWTSTV